MKKIDLSKDDLKLIKTLCFDRMQHLNEKTWRLDDDELRGIYNARYKRLDDLMSKIEDALEEEENESL